MEDVKCKRESRVFYFPFSIFCLTFSIFCLTFSIIALTILPLASYAQLDTIKAFEPAPTFNKGRLVHVIGGEVLLYSISMVGLGTIWYADYPKSNFHFFDDSKEWQQMDKAGHFMTAYYLNNAEAGMFNWAGVDKKKALWLSGTMGTLYLMTIEVFDGYSAEWGASGGDIAANIGGRLMSIGEELLWDEQRVKVKFTYHSTNFAKYRPNLLGAGGAESVIKDYNGQSYWLSANVASFLKEDTKFPPWLNIAVGYGAEGMIGGHENPDEIDGVPVSFPRYRQFYLSLDADLSKIPTKSAFLKFVFRTFGFIKIPFPALEYNSLGGVKFHPLYY